MNCESYQPDSSYIKAYKSKIVEVGNPFLELTKYKKHEILNMDINYILQKLLRLNNEITELEKKQDSYYIYTKDLDVREVQIIINTERDEILVFFKEVLYSRLDIVYLTSSIIECIKPFAGQKGVNLEFSSNKISKFTAIDIDKYEQILFNLLSNAIKFTPSGKSVCVHLTIKNTKAVISVIDEGIGIAKEKHDYIFERFGQVDGSLTRQSEGTGIGLSLVKSIIEALKGTISLKSEVGNGSTFTFTIPIKIIKTVSNPNFKGELGYQVMQSAAIQLSDIYL